MRSGNEVMSQNTIILMYHGLYDPDSKGAIEAVDRPYALSIKDFEQQLVAINYFCEMIVPEQLRFASTVKPRVLLTFDDGHVSNYYHAYPLLKKHGMSALFFVTTDFIAKKRDFCQWSQLREMADDGMFIGAHGHSHHFIADLSASKSEQELYKSKQLIEQHVGRECQDMSFPGGRFSVRDLDIAEKLGYRAVHTSEEGEVCSLFNEMLVVPRVALREGTDIGWFEQLIGGDKEILRAFRRKRQMKNSAQKLLGNRFYHAIYSVKQIKNNSK